MSRDADKITISMSSTRKHVHVRSMWAFVIMVVELFVESIVDVSRLVLLERLAKYFNLYNLLVDCRLILEPHESPTKSHPRWVECRMFT